MGRFYHYQRQYVVEIWLIETLRLNGFILIWYFIVMYVQIDLLKIYVCIKYEYITDVEFIYSFQLKHFVGDFLA